jgi:septal ring-binding cell division protein DamX
MKKIILILIIIIAVIALAYYVSNTTVAPTDSENNNGNVNLNGTSTTNTSNNTNTPINNTNTNTMNPEDPNNPIQPSTTKKVTYIIDGKTVTRAEFEVLKSTLTIETTYSSIGTLPPTEGDAGGPMIEYNAVGKDGTKYEYGSMSTETKESYSIYTKK